MGNSLFDQLKKSGLVDEKKAKQAKKEKHRQIKQQKGKQVKPAESTLQAQQTQAKKVVRDRDLNLQRKQAAEKIAIAAQIKQLIQMNNVEHSDGDIGFNFTDSGKVQRLHVTEKLRDQLSLGHLAIVKLEGSYNIVPAGVADKIKLRDPSCVLLCNVAQSEGGNTDDPYADYKVPDNLTW